MRPSQKVETFPDGIVEVYAEDHRTIGALKATLRFAEQSVGVRRYYESAASVSSSRIDRLIKVPHTSLVDRLDIVLVKTEDDRQYKIARIQEKPERNVDLWELQSIQVTIKKKVDPDPGPSPDPDPDPDPNEGGDQNEQQTGETLGAG